MDEIVPAESSAYEDIKKARQHKRVGPPKGSANSKRGKEFFAAMKRAMARDLGDGNYRKGLNRIASRLVQAAMDGEQWAIQEIANRFDGKPTQPVERDEAPALTIFEGRVRLIPVVVDAVQQPTVIEHNSVASLPQSEDSTVTVVESKT